MKQAKRKQREMQKKSKQGPSSLGHRLRELTQKAVPLSAQLVSLTQRQQYLAKETKDPEHIIANRLHHALRQTLSDEKNLIHAAERGHSEVILLKLDGLRDVKELSDLTEKEVHHLLRKTMHKEKEELRKQGFALILYPWWFQNYIALTWMKDK